MLFTLTSLVCAAATLTTVSVGVNFLIERKAARSRDAYIASLQASSAESETRLQRLDTTVEILAAMRAEDEAAAAPSCDCDACQERSVAVETLAAQGPLAHRIVVVEPSAPHRHLGFAIVRWGKS